MPQYAEILGVELLLAGDRVNARLASAQRCAVPDRGRDVRRRRQPAIARRVDPIERPQPGDALVGPVAARLALREAETVGQEYRVLGDLLCRGEVARQQRRRDVRQRLGGVGESFTRGAVGRKFPGRLEVHAGQIADGAVELEVAEPAQRHASRITGPRFCFRFQKAADPADQPFALGFGRLRLALGRHLPRFELLDHLLPRLDVLANLRNRGEAFEVDVPFFHLRGVAFETIPLHDRLYDRRVVRPWIALGRRALSMHD